MFGPLFSLQTHSIFTNKENRKMTFNLKWEKLINFLIISIKHWNKKYIQMDRHYKKNLFKIVFSNYTKLILKICSNYTKKKISFKNKL